MRRTVLSPSRFFHAEFFCPASRPRATPRASGATWRGTSPGRSLATSLVISGLLAAFSASAQSAGGADAGSTGPMLDNSGIYSQELRACRAGRTAESLSTCLREAHAAEADRKRGRLTNQGEFEQNSLERCKAFKRPDDQTACRARIVGQVEILGSVAGGGILRQAASAAPTAEAAQTAESARSGKEPGRGAVGEMGAGMLPPTPPPSDDIGKDNEDLLPEDQETGPGYDDSERLEEPPLLPEPAR